VLDVWGADTDVVVTELLYNPASVNDDEEFIELYNKGTRKVRVGGWSFTAVDYVFPAGTVIDPGAAVISAKKPSLYPTLTAYGPWNNGTGLKNDGETVTVLNAEGAEVDSVPFDNVGSWPKLTAGESIVLIDVAFDNALPGSWQLGPIGGTPGVHP